MTTWSNIDCSEEHTSIRENYGDSSFNASVVLRCAWANRHALIADIFATGAPWIAASGIEAYPASASIVPHPGSYTTSGQGIVYEQALVTVNWSSAAEETLASESIEPTMEAQVLDYRYFEWSPSGDVLLENEAPGRLIRGLNLVRTLYKQTSIPAAVFTAVGHCNQSAYVSSILGFTFVAESLLYTPGGLSRTITTSGTKGWDVTLKFRFNPNTWNKYWRAVSQTYEQIKVRSTGAVYKNVPTHAMTGLLV